MKLGYEKWWVEIGPEDWRLVGGVAGTAWCVVAWPFVHVRRTLQRQVTVPIQALEEPALGHGGADVGRPEFVRELLFRSYLCP